jgi:hypothetical protein
MSRCQQQYFGRAFKNFRLYEAEGPSRSGASANLADFVISPEVWRRRAEETSCEQVGHRLAARIEERIPLSE